MTTDFSLRERAFVEALADDTGRDLAGWMAAIAASELSGRNEIIDWLRQEGFTFSKASWIERIHHNGGRLIYGAAAASAVRETPLRRPRATAAKPIIPPAAPAARVQPIDGEIDAVLAAAKAYRPLALVLLRDCLAAVPGAEATAQSGYIILSHTRAFAAIAPSPKDVRLMLVLGTRDLADGWQRAKLPPPLDRMAPMTHMIILTDARQLDGALRARVAESARETAG
jgi:hypothetical protein